MHARLLLLLLLLWAVTPARTQPINPAMLDAMVDAVAQRMNAMQREQYEQEQARLDSSPTSRFASLSSTMHRSTQTFVTVIERLFCDELPKALIASTIFTIFALLAFVVPHFLRLLLSLVDAPHYVSEPIGFGLMLLLLLIGAYAALTSVEINLLALFGIGFFSFAITITMSAPLANIGAGFSVRSSAALGIGHEVTVAGVRGIVRSHNFTSVVLDTTSELVGAGQQLDEDEQREIDARRRAANDSIVMPNTFFTSRPITFHRYHASFQTRRRLVRTQSRAPLTTHLGVNLTAVAAGNDGLNNKNHHQL